MVARVAIDLNVRVRGALTYAGLEDASAPVRVGDHVHVYERESGLEGPAEVVEVDDSSRLIYLRVEWAALRGPTTEHDYVDGLSALLRRGSPLELGGLCRSSVSTGLPSLWSAETTTAVAETVGRASTGTVSAR